VSGDLKINLLPVSCDFTVKHFDGSNSLSWDYASTSIGGFLLTLAFYAF
jgi:hypothetical protein